MTSLVGGVEVPEPIEIPRGGSWTQPVIIREGRGLEVYNLTGKPVRFVVGPAGAAVEVEGTVAVPTPASGEITLSLTRENTTLPVGDHDWHVVVYPDGLDGDTARRVLFGKIRIVPVPGEVL
jgi:hypothetical protein